MPAQYVKPYVKTNKDRLHRRRGDRGGVGRPKMRFVPIKSDDQLIYSPCIGYVKRW